MNKTEASYAERLELQRLGGVITDWAYQPEKLRLADRTFYTPDFRVIRPDLTVEFHEVKGFWEDDARVKIKVAAEQHPYRFIAVTVRPKRDGGPCVGRCARVGWGWVSVPPSCPPLPHLRVQRYALLVTAQPGCATLLYALQRAIMAGLAGCFPVGARPEQLGIAPVRDFVMNESRWGAYAKGETRQAEGVSAEKGFALTLPLGGVSPLSSTQSHRLGGHTGRGRWM